MSELTPSFLRNDNPVLIDCKVHIPQFEGPLDLLLHLIKSHELSITDLPIAPIAKQYLNYLNYMRELNLDLASEYLVMAATLTYLKSQVILPQEDQLDLTAGKDPRAGLIRRLIELKSYKELSKALEERPRLFREVFPCRNAGIEEIEDGIEPEVAVTNPFQLMTAYTDLMSRRKQIVHRVVEDHVPIASCVQRIVEELKLHQRLSFQQLLPEVSRPQDVISMFLGVLEMAKMQVSSIEQENIFGPIFIERLVPVDEVEKANSLIKGLSWN